MTDRELLKLAAKAAGIDAKWHRHADGTLGGPYIGNSGWNPLTDDGDALRLAVKLGFSIDTLTPTTYVQRDSGIAHDYIDAEYAHDDDPYAATRRAIVRAAAEIGKGME